MKRDKILNLAGDLLNLEWEFLKKFRKGTRNSALRQFDNIIHFSKNDYYYMVNYIMWMNFFICYGILEPEDFED